MGEIIKVNRIGCKDCYYKDESCSKIVNIAECENIIYIKLPESLHEKMWEDLKDLVNAAPHESESDKKEKEDMQYILNYLEGKHK